MSTIQKERAKARGTPARWPLRPSLLLLLGFSILYFADVFLRASEKYFWYDELCTVYLCRLPWRQLWQALKAGVDFNPPVLYLLTKAANHWGGEGRIVTRLPAMIGFWVFCLCLFRLVSRRVGPAAGFTAMVLPLFTSAFYYAYEARPHGLVLGFCGLALVCWQSSLAPRWKRSSRLGFSLALWAAFLTHCYAIVIAVPFALAELAMNIRDRHLPVQRWVLLLAPGLLAALVYLPLLRSFNATVHGTVFLSYTPLDWQQIAQFYAFLLTPGLLILLLALLLAALKLSRPDRSAPVGASAPSGVRSLELLLASGFVALPVFGLLLAKALQGPFYYRYFLSALAGLALLLGWGVGARRGPNFVAPVLAGVLAGALLWNWAAVVRHRLAGLAEPLHEPSSGFSTNSSLAGPLQHYSLLLAAARQQQRIVVLWPIEFLYLVHYAPELRPYLYYVHWSETDPFYGFFGIMRPYARIPYQLVKPSELLATQPDFALFGVESDPAQIHALGIATTIKSIQFAEGRFLAAVEVK